MLKHKTLSDCFETFIFEGGRKIGECILFHVHLNVIEMRTTFKVLKYVKVEAIKRWNEFYLMF